MSEFCYGVGIEPCLQAVTEEQLKHKSANREDGARADIVAGGEIGNAHSSMSGFSTLCAKPPQHIPSSVLLKAGDGKEEDL